MKTKTVYRAIRSTTTDRTTRHKSGNVASGFGAMFSKLLFAEASLKQATLKRATR